VKIMPDNANIYPARPTLLHFAVNHKAQADTVLQPRGPEYGELDLSCHGQFSIACEPNDFAVDSDSPTNT
jgi:hypothetical protein